MAQVVWLCQHRVQTQGVCFLQIMSLSSCSLVVVIHEPFVSSVMDLSCGITFTKYFLQLFCQSFPGVWLETFLWNSPVLAKMVRNKCFLVVTSVHIISSVHWVTGGNGICSCFWYLLGSLTSVNSQVKYIFICL